MIRAIICCGVIAGDAPTAADVRDFGPRSVDLLQLDAGKFACGVRSLGEVSVIARIPHRTGTRVHGSRNARMPALIEIARAPPPCKPVSECSQLVLEHHVVEAALRKPSGLR
jgi:hypothetical protein